MTHTHKAQQLLAQTEPKDNEQALLAAIAHALLALREQASPLRHK